MQGRSSIKRAALAAALAVAMPVLMPPPAPAAVAAGELTADAVRAAWALVPRDFLTGAAEVEATLPMDGRLGAELEVETPLGVRLRLAAGTVISTSGGLLVTRTVWIGVDDAWGAASMPKSDPPEGVVRPYVLIDGAEGPSVVDAIFDPPGEIQIELGAAFQGDEWSVSAYTLDGERVLGPVPPAPTDPRPREGAPAGLLEEPGSAVGIDDAGPERVPVAAAGPIGFRFRGPPEPAVEPASPDDGSGAGVPPPMGVIHTGPVPVNAAGEPARVCGLLLVVPDTSEVVGTWSDLYGSAPGSTHFIFHHGAYAFAFTVEVRDGKPTLVIESPHANRLKVRVIWCWGESVVRTLGGGRVGGEDLPVPLDDVTRIATPGATESFETSGGSESEADETATYVGSVSIEVFGCGGWRFFRDEVLGLLRELHPGPAPGRDAVFLDRFSAVNGAFAGVMTTYGHPGSVRTLGEKLPPDWKLEFGDRKIKIRIPCPPPRTFAASASGSTVVDVELRSLELRSVLPIPSTALDGVAAADGDRGVATVVGGLVAFDFRTLEVKFVDVEALAVPIAADPRGDRFYVATGETTFEARDVETLDVVWEAFHATTEAPAGITVRPDGSYAVLTDPGNGALLRIDLLRREFLEPPLHFDGADSIAFSPDGTRLAVLDAARDEAHVVDFLAWAAEGTADVGRDPTSLAWTPDGSRVLVALRGEHRLAVVDADSLDVARVQLPSQSRPLCVTTGTDEARAPFGLVALHGANEVLRLRIGADVAPDGAVALGRPNLVRASG